jgi:arylsulfatase A-like enzyme
MTGTRRPSRRGVLGGGAGLAAAAVMGTGTAEASPGRPNIVLIMLDDVGWGDLSRYGSREIHTPEMDGVGASGVTFPQLYTPGPVCTPARAGLLTGRYPQRVGLPWVPGPQSREGLPAYERTLAEILRESGYRTGLFGKWHLGDPAMRPELNPMSHGFDEFFGIPAFNMDRPFPLYEGREIVEWLDDRTQTSLSRRCTDRAIGFVRENRNRPFFLYVPYTLAHLPYHVEDQFRGTSKAGPYGDLVQQADFHIGRLLRELDPNTLVMITSDNGPDKHGTGGLRAGKGYTFEGGIRMPFVARWPGRIAPGSVHRDPACLTDVLPTVASVAGAALPTDRPIDGVDLSRAWPGRPSRRVLYHYHDWTLNAVRRGRWKLHLPGRRNGLQPGPPQQLPPLLYDLDRDPGETRNLAGTHRRTVRELTRLGERFDAEIQAQKDEAIARAQG